MSTKRQPAGIPTGGEFAANEHDEAASSLTGAPEGYESPALRGTITTEHYDGRHSSDAVEYDIDFRRVMDTYDLDDLPEDAEDNGGLDGFFDDAEKMGLVTSTGGGYRTEIDEDDYQEYLASRRGAGAIAPLSDSLPHSDEYREESVTNALGSAVGEGGLSSVMGWESSQQAHAWATGAKERFDATLASRNINPADLDPADEEIARYLDAAASAQPGVGGNYVRSTQGIALMIGDRLISRHSGR